jgi:hypothetical protein
VGRGRTEGHPAPLDGKTQRVSGDGEKPPIHLLSAITHEDGVVLAQESVGEKTNEIKHAASLLQHVELAGTRVMATLRNLAISILRLAGATSIAKSTRWLCRNVPACLRLIGLSCA